MLIGGELRESASGQTIDAVSPATGAILGRIPRADATDVDAAVHAATDAGQAGDAGDGAGELLMQLALRVSSARRSFVRLAPFRLHRPETVEQASALLDELGFDALPYCGGTELLLVAKLGMTDFTDLVDVKGIDELAGIGYGAPSPDSNGELRLGAITTHRQIERDALVGERWPSLAAMERAVGNLRVRNVGTIGGNLCFADPHSDPATYLMAADGAVTVRRGGAAARRIPIEEFVRGPYETALEPGELLTAVHVPAPPPGSCLVHRKMSFHERPAITVAVNVTVRDGVVAGARVVVGSVGVVPLRLGDAEQALVGVEASGPSPERLAVAGDAAARGVEPVADSGGSVEYKRQLARVLVERCARDAVLTACRWSVTALPPTVFPLPASRCRPSRCRPPPRRRPVAARWQSGRGGADAAQRLRRIWLTARR